MTDLKLGIYARVSSNRQCPESQLLPLREYATARGFEIVSEYVDVISGSKDSRPELARLMADAAKRRLDVVAVWKFDRFARSTRHLVTALEQFNALGVDFISLSESIDLVVSTPSRHRSDRRAHLAPRDPHSPDPRGHRRQGGDPQRGRR